MSDRRGHIKLSRKLFEEDPWWNEKRPRTRIEAWLDLLYLAAFRARRYATKYGIIELDRGQFVASRRMLADRWHWGEKAVRNFLEVCEKWTRIRAQRETGAGTIYQIVNYDVYQSTGPVGGPEEGPEMGQTRAQRGPKREAVKQLSRKESLSEAEMEVVGFYRETHPKRLRGAVPAKTLRLLRAALEHYGVGDLRSAISGNAGSQFHQDNNHLGLDLILRDTNKIDYFIGLRETAAKEADTVEMTDDFGVMRLHRRNGDGQWEVVK